MTNPLALLPLAIAAGSGRIGTAGSDETYESQQLVAAGLTLLQRSASLVRALSGRRAAILLPTSPQFITALAAGEGRGSVLVNPLAAPAEIAFQCEDANVGAVFTNRALAGRVPEGLTHVLLDDAPRTARVVAPGRTQDVDLGSHFGLSLEGERGAEGRDEEAVIIYTSAIRGIPRGAILTHRNLLANAASCVDALGSTSRDHTLALLPYAHLFGLTVTGSVPLITGGRVSTMERFSALRAAELLSEGITQLVGVPSVYHALLAAIDRRGVSLRNSALRLCICGGAPLPVALQDRWADVTGIELRQGYGLTEAGPVCLFNRHDRPNVRGSLGVPMPNVDVVISEAGEICIRGDNVSPGYVNGAEGLAHRDGWLSTGDAGGRDDTGHFHFRGVIKPMFTRNGFNIYPREIEHVVGGMPGVEQVVADALPDPLRENDIRLRIRGRVTEDDVRTWCEQRLSAYK